MIDHANDLMCGSVIAPPTDAAIDTAKRVLKARGWSYRRAAPVLGVTYQHLCEVLNGHRQSERILRQIADLPPSP